MNIFSIAKEYYSYNDLDGWRYDKNDFLFVFWKKGFGTEVSTFEKLTEDDLIKWYEKRKIEEEKHRERIQKIRIEKEKHPERFQKINNERKVFSTSNNSEFYSPSQVKKELKDINKKVEIYQKNHRMTTNEEMELTELINRREYLLEKISQKIMLYEWNAYYDDKWGNITIGEVNGKWFLRKRKRTRKY